MSSSYQIEDINGRFITVSANSSQETVEQKAREFLINCDIRNSTKPSFGGGEYSDEAIVKAKAARASSSVHISFSDGKYSARWHSSR